MVDDRNSKPLVLGDAEDGEEIDEEKLVNTYISRRRGHGESHVEEGAHKGDVDEFYLNAKGQGYEVKGDTHGKPRDKGDDNEARQVERGIDPFQVSLYHDYPCGQFREEGALDLLKPSGQGICKFFSAQEDYQGYADKQEGDKQVEGL